jgi:ATP-binding cassette subfamily C protein
MTDPGILRPPRRRRTRRPPGRSAQGRSGLLLRVLWRTMSGRRRDAAWLAAWSMVQALPSLAVGWVVAKATGEFLAGRTGAVGGLTWLAGLGLCTLASALATRQTYLRVAALVEPLRDELVRVIVAGALQRTTQDFATPDTGAVARITHQAEIVRDSVAGLLAVGLSFLFMAASSLAGLAALVPAVLPVTVIPLAASVALFCGLLPLLATRQRRSVVTEETVAGCVAQALAGLRDVIACGAEEQVRTEIAGRVTAQAAALRSLARVNAARALCLAVGGWLPLVLVLAQAPALMRHGVAAGAIIGAVTYIAGVLQGALAMLTRGVGTSGIRLAVTLQRIAETSAPPVAAAAASRLQCPSRPQHASRPQRAGPDPALVSLRQVSFAYSPAAEPILRGLNLELHGSDHLAIVGPSGIGKSTLAGLIAGLLRPTAGEVRLSGLPLRDIPPGQLPGYRVLIPQEAYVFAGTLGDNLRYLAPGAPASLLDASADAVGLGPLVTRLGGYQAGLDPGTLSAGERQLVALARAHLSPARLAILDEATCHLDPGAAARAESAFASRPGALIVIAHRMSSALRARRVLVLDGAHASIGDHETLLGASPLYRDLVGQWHAADVSTCI